MKINEVITKLQELQKEMGADADLLIDPGNEEYFSDSFDFVPVQLVCDRYLTKEAYREKECDECDNCEILCNNTEDVFKPDFIVLQDNLDNLDKTTAMIKSVHNKSLQDIKEAIPKDVIYPGDEKIIGSALILLLEYLNVMNKGGDMTSVMPDGAKRQYIITFLLGDVEVKSE
jgi:hypothetical protein